MKVVFKSKRIKRHLKLVIEFKKTDDIPAGWGCGPISLTPLNPTIGPPV